MALAIDHSNDIVSPFCRTLTRSAIRLNQSASNSGFLLILQVVRLLRSPPS
jgi:hypothetical protein